MTHSIQLIAFDADDTLWPNIVYFHRAVERIRGILSEYSATDFAIEEMKAIETANLPIFGYGTKGFILSMIEAAIKCTSGSISGADIEDILSMGKSLATRPVELMDHAEEVLESLSSNYQLMLITKGERFEQEKKISDSGLARYFSAIEIVLEKDEDTYRRIINKSGTDFGSFLMVGDSLKSDILPVVNIGGHAVHIPPNEAWYHEQAVEYSGPGRYHSIKTIGELPNLLKNPDRDFFRERRAPVRPLEPSSH